MRAAGAPRSRTIFASRRSSPARRKAWGFGTDPTVRRSQGLSEIEISTLDTGGLPSRKCAARSSPNDSIASRRWSFASAYTVFFIVSVGRTSELSPSVCAASNFPWNRTATVRSRISWRSPRLATLTSRIPDLPYAFSPSIRRQLPR
jgi:hypothetical protein